MNLCKEVREMKFVCFLKVEAVRMITLSLVLAVDTSTENYFRCDFYYCPWHYYFAVKRLSFLRCRKQHRLYCKDTLDGPIDFPKIQELLVQRTDKD